jgi:hypothetical protein
MTADGFGGSGDSASAPIFASAHRRETRSDPPIDPYPAVPAIRPGLEAPRAASPRIDAAGQELRLFARVLLHIAAEPGIGSTEDAPESLTQSGIAEALGTNVANVSHALRRLQDGGAVRVQKSHVQGRGQRVKVYGLTEQGQDVVSHIREGMRRP